MYHMDIICQCKGVYFFGFVNLEESVDVWSGVRKGWGGHSAQSTHRYKLISDNLEDSG